MNTKILDILQNIYFDFIQEREEKNRTIQINLNRIQEIDVILSSVKEDLDFKVFSPRSDDIVQKDKIKSLETEKSELQDCNKSNYNKLNKLDTKIKQLQLLIDNFNYNKNNYFDIVDIQENERQRIANDLHDSTIQNLTHLIHSIELSSMYMDKDIISAKLELETCRMKLQSIINEMREIIFDLRPMSFDDLGFKECIENFISNLKLQFKSSQIKYDVCDLHKDDFSIDDDRAFNLVLLTIYRIIKEAIINALKHSDADNILLKVNIINDECFIFINDNGNGFENCNGKEDKHFGILIMEERVDLLRGNMSIETKLGSGTKIEVRIPLKQRKI